MKDVWVQRYRDHCRVPDTNNVDVLTAFNANIDVMFDVEDMNLDFEDVESEDLDELENIKDLKSMLKYCMEEGINEEASLEGLEHSFDSGEERIGGQAGIMANYLSGMGNSVIFYTPFLSQELADMINVNVLFPTIEDDFVLKNVRDAANTDRTKKNMIFEFDSEKTGRLIASDSIKGFGPYFRKSIVEGFDEMDQNLDRVLISGFHDVEGNKEAKLEKARKQLDEIETLTHMEYVNTDDKTAEKIIKKIFPKIDSVGLDEEEAKQVREIVKSEDTEGELTTGHAFKLGKELIEDFDLSRCQVHTYNFHITVVEDDYPVETEKIRDAMLFGEISAIKTAERGSIVQRKDLKDLDMEDKHIKRMDMLEDFADFFQIDNFVRDGTGKVEGYRVAAIPTIIHEDPKRVVGMGDILSSGAFVGEVMKNP
ncbi:MAG: ADP-dependent glucokinase/phosphofructokinase [Candidatus Nanohalobium sp.]